MRLPHLSSMIVVVLALAVTGCDPEGPGARGTISLGAGADVSQAYRLEIRVFPDPEDSFEPGIAIENEELRAESLLLGEVEFPFDYEVGHALGTSDHRQWRVVAWVAEGSDPAWIAPGEFFGTTLFDLASCGDYYGGYCQVTGGVDVTIEEQAP